ncbi:type II toxin-antitoxin system RelE/ParE family toxin [Alcaligenes faecalis]|uniref:type II toxin-antitoxin system RelE/ParE family toxin n=1 Tax=Alcaligenes faecalis TaxID=511 RepID=UPI0034D6F869
MSSFERQLIKYKLKFVPEALQELGRLDGSVKTTFKNLLRKRLDAPHVPGAALRGDLLNCYKIKLLKQAIVWFIPLRMMFWWFWSWR